MHATKFSKRAFYRTPHGIHCRRKIFCAPWQTQPSSENSRKRTYRI